MTSTTHTTFGERMKAAREAAGLSTMNAAYAIRSRLPEPLWISNDPIRRMENGKTTEDKADPLLVTALAAVYGVRVRDLSPLVADSLGAVDALLHATQVAYADQQEGLSIWNDDTDQVVSGPRVYDEPLFHHPPRDRRRGGSLPPGVRDRRRVLAAA